MRLLKQVSRKYNDMKYHKHWIIIPNKLIHDLGWDEGQDLKAEVKDKKLIIEKEK